MRGFIWAAGMCCAGVIATSAAGADRIYKCVDREGVTYYSESRPATGPCETLTVTPVERDVPGPADPAYQSALDVAGDIQASRLERERLRLERERLRLEQAQAASARNREYSEDRSYYYPAYPWYSSRHPRPHPFSHGKRPMPRRGWGDRPWPQGGPSGARVPGFGGR